MKYINEVMVVIVFTICCYWVTFAQSDDQVMDLKIYACKFQYITIKDFLIQSDDLSEEQVVIIKKLIKMFEKNCGELPETLYEREILYPSKLVSYH